MKYVLLKYVLLSNILSLCTFDFNFSILQRSSVFITYCLYNRTSLLMNMFFFTSFKKLFKKQFLLQKLKYVLLKYVLLSNILSLYIFDFNFSILLKYVLLSNILSLCTFDFNFSILQSSIFITYCLYNKTSMLMNMFIFTSFKKLFKKQFLLQKCVFLCIHEFC